MLTAPAKKPVKSKKVTNTLKNVKESDWVPAYDQFFKANPSPKWIGEDVYFSLEQPWPYDFPPTDATTNAVICEDA